MVVILQDNRRNKEQISDMQVTIGNRAIFMHHVNKDKGSSIITILQTEDGYQLSKLEDSSSSLP